MESCLIPIITLSQFADRIKKNLEDVRIPLSGSIEVTARCNLRCKHCYINIPAADERARTKELTYKEFCDIFDQITNEGCLWLLLTGGEPFIRPDFLDIYTYAKKKGMLITLFTNGTLLTPYIADFLSDWRPQSIELTLYGLTQKTYEEVTDIDGSHKRCMYGIELLLDRKLPLKLKTMVMTINKHEIWEIKRFAENLGVDFRFDPVLNLRINGDKSPSDFRISPQEIVALDLADTNRMRELSEFCEKFLNTPDNLEYIYQCGAGRKTFHIDPYGQLSVCIMSRIPSYDLRSGYFRDGWYNFMQSILSRKWVRNTRCKGCELISLCGQCPGWAQIENGNPESPVDYLCQIARLRAD
ncbi:MAG: radical SAM protein, partial [Nitrospirota bacterium]